jgi:hypothetical protein
MTDTKDTSSMTFLVSFPSELIYQILAYLPVDALASLSQTCHSLHRHATSEELWKASIQQYLSGPPLESPYPYDSFRKLYATHHPCWFLMKHRVWIGDSEYTGKVLVMTFDPRRGCIEGYQLVASMQPNVLLTWPLHPAVYVAQFLPKVGLHRDRPILQLSPKAQDQWEKRLTGPSGLEHEIVMPSSEFTKGIQHSTLMTTKAIPDEARHPSTALWPPLRIPSKQRVRNASGGGYRDPGHKPKDLASICEDAFRIRHWGQLTNLSRMMGVHMGEKVTTYGALQPQLYTPTAQKPWRGLWVGDYPGHQYEFLLIHQPDDEIEEESKGPEYHSTNGEPIEGRTAGAVARCPSQEVHPASHGLDTDVGIYRGSLEAIKLTGDPNVPRGEYSFRVEDLGPSGLLRVADEEPFAGARVMRAKGQIAEKHGFNDGKD